MTSKNNHSTTIFIEEQSPSPEIQYKYILRFGWLTQPLAGAFVILFIIAFSFVNYKLCPSIWFQFGGIYTGIMAITIVYQNVFLTGKDLLGNDPRDPITYKTNFLLGFLRLSICLPYGALKTYAIYNIFKIIYLKHYEPSVAQFHAQVSLIFIMQAQFAFSGVDWFYSRGAVGATIFNPKLHVNKYFRCLYSTLFQYFGALVMIIVYLSKSLSSNYITTINASFIIFGLAVNIGLGEYIDSFKWKKMLHRASFMYFCCLIWMIIVICGFIPLWKVIMKHFNVKYFDDEFHIVYNIQGAISCFFPAFQISYPLTNWENRSVGKRTLLSTIYGFLWVCLIYALFSVWLPKWSVVFRMSENSLSTWYPLDVPFIGFAFMLGNTIYAWITLFNGAGLYKRVLVEGDLVDASEQKI